MCVFDFFTEYRDSDTYDPGEAALVVVNLARAVGPTGQYESRIAEMADSIQEWIDEKPQRERTRKLQEPIGFITEELEEFQDAEDSVEMAKALIVNCQPKLTTVRSIFGSSDKLYLQLSSALANNAMGMLVNFINEQQEAIKQDRYLLVSFPKHTAAALEVQKLIASLDLTSEIRTRVQENLTGLRNIHSPFVAFARTRLTTAETEMAGIMGWQFGRSSEDKARQVSQQNTIIAKLKQELQTLQDALA